MEGGSYYVLLTTYYVLQLLVQVNSTHKEHFILKPLMEGGGSYYVLLMVLTLFYSMFVAK